MRPDTRFEVSGAEIVVLQHLEEAERFGLHPREGDWSRRAEAVPDLSLPARQEGRPPPGLMIRLVTRASHMAPEDPQPVRLSGGAEPRGAGREQPPRTAAPSKNLIANHASALVLSAAKITPQHMGAS